MALQIHPEGAEDEILSNTGTLTPSTAANSIDVISTPHEHFGHEAITPTSIVIPHTRPTISSTHIFHAFYDHTIAVFDDGIAYLVASSSFYKNVHETIIPLDQAILHLEPRSAIWHWLMQYIQDKEVPRLLEMRWDGSLVLQVNLYKARLIMLEHDIMGAGIWMKRRQQRVHLLATFRCDQHIVIQFKGQSDRVVDTHCVQSLKEVHEMGFEFFVLPPSFRSSLKVF